MAPSLGIQTCEGGGEGRVATARDVGDSEDANEDLEVVGDGDSLEDKNSLKGDDGGLARRYSGGGRKTLLMYFPRDSVEELEGESCGDAETMWFAMV